MSQLYIEPTTEEIVALRPPTSQTATQYWWDPEDNVMQVGYGKNYIKISLLEVALKLGLKDLVCPPSWEQLGFEDFHNEFLSFNPELGTVHNIFLSDPTPLAYFDTEIEARKYVWLLQLCQLAEAGA